MLTERSLLVHDRDRSNLNFYLRKPGIKKLSVKHSFLHFLSDQDNACGGTERQPQLLFKEKYYDNFYLKKTINNF